MDSQCHVGQLTLSTGAWRGDTQSLRPVEAAAELERLRWQPGVDAQVDALVKEVSWGGRYRIPDRPSGKWDVLWTAALDGVVSVRKNGSKAVAPSCTPPGPARAPQTPYRPQPPAREPTRIDFFVETELDHKPVTGLELKVQRLSGTEGFRTDSTGRVHFSSPESQPVTVLGFSGRFVVMKVEGR